MPLVIYGAAHTGKQISVIFQKKRYPAYNHTITGNFFEKFFNDFRISPKIFYKIFFFSQTFLDKFSKFQKFFWG
jgi:hypothetical protein